MNIKKAGIIEPVYGTAGISISSDLMEIKRGVGSYIYKEHNTEVTSFTVNVDSEQSSSKMISFNPNTIWVEKNGNLGTEIWDAFSTILISNDIFIQEGQVLTINEGTIVKLCNQADIICEGKIVINGTIANPVIFTSENSNELWGGFIFTGGGSVLSATGAIFINSGANAKEISWGHVGGQPLLYFPDASTINVDKTYILDTYNQAFGGSSSNVTIKNSLIQRAESAGQINASSVIIEDSYLMDFPDNSSVYIDRDNDALYFAASTTAALNKVVIINCKDDGVDSGNMGNLTLNNCWIESCYHEGLALTSDDDSRITHSVYNTVVRNCSQGIELGYSGIEHVVNVEHCLIVDNDIGIRHGDNYIWDGIGGVLNVKNSILRNDTKDAWDFHFNNWDSSNRLYITNTLFSIADVIYPGNLEGIPELDTRNRLVENSIGYNAADDCNSIGLIN